MAAAGVSKYPRDLVGYGRDPPDPRWPGGARVAVQFVINYEEGGERNILHGDATSEAFLSDVLGAQPWPGQRHMNVESMYEYGSRAGFWRLWRLFSERNMAVTVFGVATALARSPDAVAAMREARWEIASHGLKWIDYKDMPEAEERAHLARGDPHPHAGDRRAPARLVHRPQLGQYLEGRARRRRLPLFLGFLRRRPALLDQRAERTAPDHSLHARRQRHALHQCPGLRHRRRFLRLSQGRLRPALCRRRAGAQDDVGRAALPAGRPPRARGRARALSRLCRRARARMGRDAGSTSRGIGTASIGRWPPAPRRSPRAKSRP